MMYTRRFGFTGVATGCLWAAWAGAWAIASTAHGQSAAPSTCCGTLGENIASQDTHPMPPSTEFPGPTFTQNQKDSIRPPASPYEDRGTCTGSGLGLFYPFDPANTTGWTLAMARNDDGSSALINLGFTFQFYGVNYTSCYINNNGNITFGSPYSPYVPSGFPSSTVPPMIAPFWADADTRNTTTGRVWYKIIDSNNGGLVDTLVVTWDNVGYFNSHADLLDTFQLVISNFTNPLMQPGSNVCFDYDNMCWTTGDINGTGGFTNPPSATTGNATVGINKGDGVSYFQVGRFGLNSSAYDGPFGNADGINYLDNKRFCFNTQSGNVPPVATNLPTSNTYNVSAGQVLNQRIQFLSPEFGQTTTITYLDQDGAVARGLVLGITNGNVASLDLDWATGCSDEGQYTVIVTARDNFNPRGETVVSLTINVNGVGSIPSISITDPTTLECVCDNFIVRGTATGTNFGSYTLAWSTTPDGPFTTIVSSTTAVVNGVLGTWDTTPVPTQGYYYLRLRASNTCGPATQEFVLVWVEKGFDPIALRRPPASGSIIGGNDYCLDGTVNDTCFQNYTVSVAPSPFTTFTPVDPANPTYASPVINDPIASWDTASGPGSVVDGTYRLRIIGTNMCGLTATLTRDVIVDNTPPIALISSPTNCQHVVGTVAIRGTARDLHLAGWSLQYTGGDAHGWVSIASGTSNISNGLLANWNTAALRPCAYTLRLIVTDQAVLDCNDASRNQSEYLTSVTVGCPSDVDDGSGLGVPDGGVTIEDLLYFLERFGAGC